MDTEQSESKPLTSDVITFNDAKPEIKSAYVAIHGATIKKEDIRNLVDIGNKLGLQNRKVVRVDFPPGKTIIAEIYHVHREIHELYAPGETNPPEPTEP